MSELFISEVKPGMRLEQAIVMPDGKTLLSSGTILSIKNIEKLHELNIKLINIADRYTHLITPIDKMQTQLVEDFTRMLRQIAPNSPEANKSDEVVKVANMLEKIILKIAKNETVLEFMVELRIIDKVKLYDHSVHTAVLAGLVAGSMGLDMENILCAVTGGLLHNIGVAEMPTLLNIKEMTPPQQTLWREHPTYGYYFAIQKNISRTIANCIQYHHERYDGTGYPKGIKGEEIPLLARIISICAKYSAAITYENISPYMAVEEIYGASGIYYDPEVVKAFVNNIPIYPLGVMVRLSTKEVGIVSNIRKNKGPRPIIKVYYNRVNRPITEDKIIDLGVERTIFIEEIL
ncbi:MAG: HD domain-containing phosphohydrolase [Lachnospiraceae bacterium]|nr:HD domain-containing protein [Lachnospiraceae bacterium]MEE0686331.1 HD domain-containing phosphohydrolase [Lachnospiraceae bacterium]